jgi:hypothetical protein
MIKVALIDKGLGWSENAIYTLWLGSQGFKYVVGWMWEVCQVVGTEDIELGTEDIMYLVSMSEQGGIITIPSGLELELLPDPVETE